MPADPKGQTALSKLPAVDAVLRSPEGSDLLARFPRVQATDAVRAALGALRRRLVAGEAADAAPAAVARDAALRLAAERRKGLRRVVNATGVILHTGLGRAPLSAAARRSILELGGYGSLELDVETNERGQRDAYCARLLCRLTGAQDACVVNNNAAATMLALSSLSEGREVVVARGQLVEIGGSFRLPEVMEKSGAALREVGTTNRVRLADYERAAGKGTGLLLRVHTSNYRVVGFTEDVAIEELVRLGRRKRVPVMDDIGSGAMLDFARFGLEQEPTVRRSVAAGADLVAFSGDKLLGGPQSGILVGRRDAVEACRRNPLYRAFRVGKTVLGPLQATLEAYLSGEERAAVEIPSLRMIRAPLEGIRRRAEAIASALSGSSPSLGAEAVKSESQLGSGSMPGQVLPSWAVSLRPQGRSAERLARDLRLGDPPILGRVQRGALLLDLRTVDPAEDVEVVRAVAAAEGAKSPP